MGDFVCNVRKLCCLAAMRHAGGCFKLHRSAKEMTRLTGKKILCAIQECKKGRKAYEIAAETAVVTV